MIAALNLCSFSLFFVSHFSFSRYGDEHKLAGFSATLQAIISFVENGYVAGFVLVNL